jgi:hypothetical protein
MDSSIDRHFKKQNDMRRDKITRNLTMEIKFSTDRILNSITKIVSHIKMISKSPNIRRTPTFPMRSGKYVTNLYMSFSFGDCKQNGSKYYTIKK